MVNFSTTYLVSEVTVINIISSNDSVLGRLNGANVYLVMNETTTLCGTITVASGHEISDQVKMFSVLYVGA